MTLEAEQGIDVMPFIKRHQEKIRREEIVYELELARIEREEIQRRKGRANGNMITAGMVVYGTCDAINAAANVKAIKKAAIPAFIIGTTIMASYVFGVKELKKAKRTDIVLLEKQHDYESRREIDEIIEIEQKSSETAVPNTIAEAKAVQETIESIAGERLDEKTWFGEFGHAITYLDHRQLRHFNRVRPYIDTFRKVSEITGKDPTLFAALIDAESDFNPNKPSYVGAIGLGQMTDIAFSELNRQLGLLKNEHDPLRVLVGEKADKQKYKTNNDYQIQVSSAYLDLLIDYFSRFQLQKAGQGSDKPYRLVDRPAEFFETHDRGYDSVEAAVAAYNSGHTKVKSLLENEGVKWASMKYPETRTHWSRFRERKAIFDSIEDEFKKYAMERKGEYELAQADTRDKLDSEHLLIAMK